LFRRADCPGYHRGAARLLHPRNGTGCTVFKLINDTRGPDHWVYALDSENLAYFTIGSGQALYDEPKRHDAGYFLINRYLRRLEIPDEESFHGHFRTNALVSRKSASSRWAGVGRCWRH
jgi:hypothetical protein